MNVEPDGSGDADLADTVAQLLRRVAVLEDKARQDRRPRSSVDTLPPARLRERSYLSRYVASRVEVLG